MLTVTPTRLGWARFSDDRVDGAARFERRDGRLVAVEAVVVGRPALVDRLPRARLEAWANGVGRSLVAGGLAERAAMERWGVVEVDAAERSEPARRAEWGAGPAAEAEQGALLALVAEAPEGPKPDEFYAEVAEVYARAAVQSASPAVAVAEANGVEAATVRAWVREARRRGLMPAGRKGAA